MDPETFYFECPDYRPDNCDDYIRGFSVLEEITSPYDIELDDIDDFYRELYSDYFQGRQGTVLCLRC